MALPEAGDDDIEKAHEIASRPGLTGYEVAQRLRKATET
jgi:hypothetical protein